MKRWLFIIGIIIILSLISIWLFLLFASNETKSDIYNRFGFTGTQEGGVIKDIVDAILPDLEPEKVPLRQLTTKRSQLRGRDNFLGTNQTHVYRCRYFKRIGFRRGLCAAGVSPK